MKIIAYILNVALLVMAIYLFVDQVGDLDFDDVMIYSLLFACPIVNSIALLFGNNYEGWLRLYFKRKAIEEKKKIEALSDKKES